MTLRNLARVTLVPLLLLACSSKVPDASRCSALPAELVWMPRPAVQDPAEAATSFFRDYLEIDQFVEGEVQPITRSMFKPTVAGCGEITFPITVGALTMSSRVSLVETSGTWAVREIRTDGLHMSKPLLREGDQSLRVNGRARSPSGQVYVEVKPARIPGGLIRLILGMDEIPRDVDSPFSVSLALQLPHGTQVNFVAYAGKDRGFRPHWPLAITAIPVTL